MRKVITFLGTQKRLTTYRYRGQDYSGRVFAEALCQFESFDQMLVFTTEAARKEVYPVLAELGDPRITPVDIPIGRNTDELWELFDALTRCIDHGDTVVFDITHGLRSIPFLVFLAAAFLRSAKDVSIQAIYYGALEINHDEDGKPQPAPVIELSRFVSLLDWLVATRRFIETGDGHPLVKLIRSGKPAGAAMRDDLEARAVGRALEQAAQAIDTVSLALRLARPMEAMEQAKWMPAAVEQAQSALLETARPFTILSAQVRDAYAPFGLEDPLSSDKITTNLRLQLDMIQWYIKRDQVAQALIVAREWLVSLVIQRIGGLRLIETREMRDNIEQAIWNAMEANERRLARKPTVYDARVATLPEQRLLIGLWQQLANLRNDLAHAGMNSDPRSASKLARAASTTCKELEELWRITQDDAHP